MIQSLAGWAVTLFAAGSIFVHAAESVGGIGVGLAIDKETQMPKITRVLPGGAAAKAGLKTGLFLHKIGEVVVERKSVTECAELIRGPLNTPLVIEVLDAVKQPPRRVELIRSVIPTLPKLKLGDAAPPVQIKEWVRGNPVNVLDGQAIYVVEFWATWCGPCRTSIPHLSALQKRLQDKGVVFVGVSDEPAATVNPFVKRMGDQMSYRVACDDEQQTYAAYMEPFGLNSIPTAFIVNKEGRLVWHGHPMAGLDKELQKLLSDQTK